MKTHRRIFWICVLVLQFAVVVSAQSPTSIDQLRDQIQKLTTIANDPTTDPDVRKINQGFLLERRKQLGALLREKMATLQKYQSKVAEVLTDAEKQALAQSVSDLRNEIAALESGHVAASAGNGDAPAPSANPAAAGAPSIETASITRPAPLAVGNGTSISPGPNTLAATAPVATAPAATAPAAPPQQPDDFNNWLNARIEERIKANAQARIDQRSNVNQTETPAIANNSTSLVDQSSASDLVGLGLNLAGLTQDNNSGNSDKPSATVTATAYSLYSMFRGEQPLDPAFYNKHRDWRRLSFTLGFEKGQLNAQGQTTEDTTIAGAKYLIFSGRDASKHQRELGTVYQYLKAAATNLGQLTAEIKNEILFGKLRDRLRIPEAVRAFVQGKLSAGSLNAQQRQEFQDLLDEPVESWFDPAKIDAAHLQVRVFVRNEYFKMPGFALLQQALDEEALKEIDELIDARLDAFTGLNNAARRAIEQIRKAPQFSLAFQSRLQKQEPDEYKGQAIFEYGIHDRLNLTLNGSFLYRNSRFLGADTRRAQFAGQLQFQMTPEKSLAGRSPLYLFLASEGDWGNGISSIFKVQGKVKIPLFEGVDFPISLTYANRTELINERDVRGQFGFTFDTAKLLRAFLSKR
ncbi:MAG TPA: hypothetical protein VFZ40_00730 [Pyrinomonadaceae bacterium]